PCAFRRGRVGAPARRLAARPPPAHRLGRLHHHHAGGAPAHGHSRALAVGQDPAGAARPAAGAALLQGRDPGPLPAARPARRLAPFGGNREGVRAASLAYFGKEPRRLSVAEAALLVAIPQSPEARRPDRSPDATRRARNRVLIRLLVAGAVSGEDAARAMAE